MKVPRIARDLLLKPVSVLLRTTVRARVPRSLFPALASLEITFFAFAAGPFYAQTMRCMWLTVLTVVVTSHLACQTTPGPRPPGARVGKLSGLATWYGGKRWHGRLTASGEIFDQFKLTAAHKRLPFGTWVRVKNLRNGRTVTVRITDRGPYGKGRIIDLSRAGAKRLGMLVAGVVPVKVTVLSWGTGRKKGWQKTVRRYKARQRRLRLRRQRRLRRARRARQRRRLRRLRRRCRTKRYRRSKQCQKLRRARRARRTRRRKRKR